MDNEYEIEAENDADRDVSPPTNDDEATAFADDSQADPEWTAQYEKEMWNKSQPSDYRAVMVRICFS